MREHNEAFLLKHHWEPDGEDLWRDPLGSNHRAESTVEIHLPKAKKDGGGFTIVKQKRGPVAAMSYSTAEAVWMQKERNKAGGAAVLSPSQRCRELERVFNVLLHATQAVVEAKPDPKTLRVWVENTQKALREAMQPSLELAKRLTDGPNKSA